MQSTNGSPLSLDTPGAIATVDGGAVALTLPLPNGKAIVLDSTSGPIDLGKGASIRC